MNTPGTCCYKRELQFFAGIDRAISNARVNLRSVEIDRVLHHSVIEEFHVYSLSFAHMQDRGGHSAVEGPCLILHAIGNFDRGITRDQIDIDFGAIAYQRRQNWKRPLVYFTRCGHAQWRDARGG